MIFWLPQTTMDWVRAFWRLDVAEHLARPARPGLLERLFIRAYWR